MHDLDATKLLDSVRPGLASSDVQRIARDVVGSLTARQVCGLLTHQNVDVRRVAAMVVGLVGDRQHEGCLVHALHDADKQVNEMAEHSLWSIWFRAARPEAVQAFRSGMDFLGMESYDAAIDSFREAQQLDLDFAEVYHQCAIAHLLQDDYEEALDDCRETIKRVPVHFGAIAGLGHCYMQARQYRRALESYKRALTINPRMTGIQRTIERLEERFVSQSGAID
jgi:tetratricopeptide (TPR) repeat protein